MRGTRREFLRSIGTGALVITAGPMLFPVLARDRELVLAESLQQKVTPFIFPSREVFEQAIVEARGAGADYVDVFVERNIRRTIRLQERKLTSITYEVDQGVGIRALYGRQTGYAYCEDFSPQTIMETARMAAESGKGSKSSESQPLSPHYRSLLTTTVTPQAIPLRTLSEDTRIEVIRRADEAARAVNPIISDVTVTFQESDKEIMIATSTGLWLHDAQPLLYFMVDALGASNGNRHKGHSRISLTGGFELFDHSASEQQGRRAGEEVVRMLKAKDAPSGEMPVVVTNGWGGVLFHEAVGHGLEGDAVSRGLSFFADKVGQRVASDMVTFVDDATLPGLRGSYNIDDEGQPSARKVLIEKGILRGFMTDRLSGEQLGVPSTGNGRRESFRHSPLVRMSNTFILNGSAKPEDIISGTKRGIYARNFAGGVVDTTSGNFTFTVTEAYLIEEGKITSPIKRITLIGRGSDALQSIDMVADDLDFSPGTCGKGQWVPITSGQPTLRLSKITVGGTKV